MPLLVNEIIRRMETLFPGYFPDFKHNHYKDFGWPADVTIDQLYSLYRRNALAYAAVAKITSKTWQTMPELVNDAKRYPTNVAEMAVKDRFEELNVWRILAEADRRALVCGYSGVIIRYADDNAFDKPVVFVSGGLNAIVELIPVWRQQLTVAQWNTDLQSPDYGKPQMFQFNETAVVANEHTQGARMFDVHPDRVLIWSRDGTVHNHSSLLSGFNDLLTIEKITGAGGEGFWKNAKGGLSLQLDKEARLDEMARAMGVETTGLVESMNTQVEQFNKGFDQMIMTQGMEVKPVAVTLPIPEHFRAGAVQNFAASVQIPMKVLLGMQTGERASSEDAQEWSQTIMGRRADETVPGIMRMLNKLRTSGVLPPSKWRLEWADLTEANLSDRILRAKAMADINAAAAASGMTQVMFLPEEIRAAVDMAPLTPEQSSVAGFGKKEDSTNANDPDERERSGRQRKDPKDKA